MSPTIQQVRVFSNGVKAVLRPQAKNGAPALLRIFNKDNCLIAQREIQSYTDSFGKHLKKLTLRNNKEFDSSLEYLHTTLSEKSDTYSARWVYKGNTFYCNNNHGRGHLPYYYQVDYLSTSSARQKIELNSFPLTNPTIKPITKRDEISALEFDMFYQWFDSKKRAFRKTPKPMKVPELRYIKKLDVKA